MKTALNKKITKIIGNGNYIKALYYETLEMTRKRMSETDYSYYTTTADNILHFYTKEQKFEMNIKDFDWRILWDKLGNIPVNEEDELEEAFEHFNLGAEKMEVWAWFEWFFNIKLGELFYK